MWLVVSAVAGLWLITDTPGSGDVAVDDPTIDASSRHAAYGGDAYTGIQNAASDTEHAVVDGVNELGGLAVELREAAAAHDRDLVGRLTQALGVLVISLGFVNLNIALGRPTHVAHAPPA